MYIFSFSCNTHTIELLLHCSCNYTRKTVKDENIDSVRLCAFDPFYRDREPSTVHIPGLGQISGRLDGTAGFTLTLPPTSLFGFPSNTYGGGE